MIKLLKQLLVPFRKRVYHLSGKKPWSYGYNDARWDLIYKSILNTSLLNEFNNKSIPANFGIGFDERVVEYPWILGKLLLNKGTNLLDAGSTFNFLPLINHERISIKKTTIFTYYPEQNCYIQNRISYDFGDLRDLPYKNELFDEIVCQSTIEHIDMDNSIYGYEISKHENITQKSYEYLRVIDELVRVLKNNGKLVLTFPYGIFENHGFFQQFDSEMTQQILDKLKLLGSFNADYLLYTKTGWKFATAEECANSRSYNPHTGNGKGTDGAAHCRCVCCIEFIKSK